MDTATVSPVASAPATSKHPLTLTDRAVMQVKEVMKSQSFEGYCLSVRVMPAGCSGMGYDLNLIKESTPGDIVWEQDGVKIATDALSVTYLAGTEVDFVSGVTGTGFKFSNPNAKQSCGCGTSFST